MWWNAESDSQRNEAVQMKTAQPDMLPPYWDPVVEAAFAK